MIAKPRKHRWWRRIGVAAFLLVILLAAFHRPLFFEITRYFAVRIAHKQNLNLEYDIGGSIFSSLRITNLRATPRRPGPIQRIEVGFLSLEYSFWGLLKNGLPGFLESLKARDVYIELTAEEKVPESKGKEQSFKFPALIPKELSLKNINVLVHSEKGINEISGFTLTLWPQREGILHIDTLKIAGLSKWVDISGITSFRNRNLIISDVYVSPQIQITKFQLDASRLNKSQLEIKVDGSFLDGLVSANLNIQDLNASNRLTISAQCSGLSFQNLGTFINFPMRGELKQCNLDLRGYPGEPQSWKGSLTIATESLIIKEQSFGRADLLIALRKGYGTVEFSQRLGDDLQFRLSGDVILPKQLKKIAAWQGKGTFFLNADNLESVSTVLHTLKGNITMQGAFAFKNGIFNVKGDLDGKGIATDGFSLSTVTTSLEGVLDISSGRFNLSDVNGRTRGKITDLEAKWITLDNIAWAVSMKDGNLLVDEFVASRKDNIVSVQGRYRLPVSHKNWIESLENLQFSVQAPDLNEFTTNEFNYQLRGQLNIHGKIEKSANSYFGKASLLADDLSYQGVTVNSVTGELNIQKETVNISDLKIIFNNQNIINAGGSIELLPPYEYHGFLNGRLKNLSIFSDIFPNKAVDGSLTITWKGRGAIEENKHFGNLHIESHDVIFDGIKGLSADVTMNYSPNEVILKDWQIASNELGTLSGDILWKQNRVKVDHLSLQDHGKELLSGELSIPLTVGSNKEKIDSNEPIDAAIKVTNFPLKKIFKSTGISNPPLSGAVSMQIAADGTLANPDVHLSLKGTDLHIAKKHGLGPANLELDATLQGGRLTIDSTLRQPFVEPLHASAKLPIDLLEIQKSGAIPKDLPITAELSFPKSSLEFLSELAPAIRQSRGDISMRLYVTGTARNPQLQGSLSAKVATLRFSNPSLPPLSNATIQLDFDGNEILLKTFYSRVGGGWASLKGKVIFASLSEPIFDLQLGASKVLVFQNDEATVRVSGELSLRGPLQSAAVAGNLGITRGRFLKNIEILPIGLPGRPAPTPPPQEPFFVSFPNPPLRNWTFDVTVKTWDPFLIQGNLANGKVTMDVHLGGTGLAPWLEGSIFVNKLLVSLPFSILNIESGRVWFTRDRPFMPILNLHGTTEIRDYNINAYVYGPAVDPDVLFFSNPPLPQSEVVSLLATGMTTQELVNNPSLLAGNAALLLLRRIYHSVFERGKEGKMRQSFFDRIRLDLGVIDPKTGEQSMAIHVPLTDELVLTGGMDVGGNFRGQLRYLIRFR